MEQLIHYITDLIATFVGVHLYLKSRVIDTLTEQQRLFILIGALLGALIGSRFFAALENPELFLNPPSFMYYFTNKTIIGGIAGGIVGIEIVKKILKISAWTGDRTVIPLAVAIIIGRIGCFIAGVEDGTVGGPCEYAWCLEQGDAILRHPNSLYEIGFVALFLFAYHLVLRIKPFFLRTILQTQGASFRLFIVLYFSLRFGIEFLKETNVLILNLNSIQFVCLGFVVWYLRDLIRIHMFRKVL